MILIHDFSVIYSNYGEDHKNDHRFSNNYDQGTNYFSLILNYIEVSRINLINNKYILNNWTFINNTGSLENFNFLLYNSNFLVIQELISSLFQNFNNILLLDNSILLVFSLFLIIILYFFKKSSIIIF